MAGKARVHELAKELGVTSKEVLAQLSREGMFVKSASSRVEAPVARRLRAFFGTKHRSPTSNQNPRTRTSRRTRRRLHQPRRASSALRLSAQTVMGSTSRSSPTRFWRIWRIRLV